MKIFRPSRFIVAMVALFSTLFMQCAMASYVCPGMSMGTVNIAMTTMSEDNDSPSMPGCNGMDKNQPSLCHAHAQDQQSKQSLDKPQLPDVQPFLAVGLVLASYTIDFDVLLAPAQPESRILARSTAPPIAIVNCCFRI